MAWTSFSDKPEFMVYRTEDLLQEGLDPTEGYIWKKTFTTKHSRLDARMLDRSEAKGDRIKIMIYENPTPTSGKWPSGT